MPRRQRAWWVSAKEGNDGSGWHWRRFFIGRNRRDEGMHWGGPEWIRSTLSIARIAEMRAGDFVVAYQGGEGIVGFARTATGGYKAKGSKNTDIFDLRPSPAIWLPAPVPLDAVKRLPGARDTFEFVRGARGTVFTIEAGGLERVIGLALAFNPELGSRLTKLAF